MDPSRKIEIEPLSDARWAKIEKGIFAQLEHERLDLEPLLKMTSQPPPARTWRRRPAVALVMAGAMAAAVGALATKSLFTGSSPDAAPVASVSRVVTGGSDSHVALGESDVDVAPDSAVLVSGDDAHGIMVVVDHGKVECEVAPRKGRPPFLVQAGDVRVKVVGTRFTVARDAQGGGAHVLVAHGIVEVTSHGQTTTLHDGDSWPAPQTAIAPTNAAPVTQNEPPVSTPRATLRARSKSAPVAKTATPRGAAPIAVSDPPAPPVLGGAPPAAPPSPASLNLPPPPVQATPALPVAPPPVQATPPPSAQEMYEAAAQLEAQNPEGSLATYKKLAGGGGAWAANALFAAGRLQAHRGRNGDAARLLDEYLVRFPNGANAADARELLAKISPAGR